MEPATYPWRFLSRRERVFRPFRSPPPRPPVTTAASNPETTPRTTRQPRGPFCHLLHFIDQDVVEQQASTQAWCSWALTWNPTRHGRARDYRRGAGQRGGHPLL